MCFMCGGIHYGEIEGLVSVERWSCSRCVYNVRRERVLVADSLVSHEPTCVLLYLGLEVVRGHSHTTTFTPHLTHQPSIRCRGRGEYLCTYAHGTPHPHTHVHQHTPHTHTATAAKQPTRYIRMCVSLTHVQTYTCTDICTNMSTVPLHPPPTHTHTYSSLYLWPALL